VRSFKIDANNERLTKSSGLGGTYYVVQFNLRVDSNSNPASGNKVRWDVFSDGSNYVCMWLSYDGSNYKVGANEILGTSKATFTISTDTTYAIKFVYDVSGNAWTFDVDSDTKDNDTADMLTVTMIKVGYNGYNASAFESYIDDVIIYNTDPAGNSNIWMKSGAVVTEPKVLTYDGALGVNSVYGGLDTNGEWNWNSNTLYFRYTSDPDALTSPGIEYGQRNNALRINGPDYVDFNDIIFEFNNNDAANSVGEVSSGSNYINFTDCIFRFGAYTGLFIDSNGGSAINCVFSYNGNIGIDIDSCDDFTASGGSAHHNTGSGASGVYVGAITPTADDVTVTGMEIYSNDNGIKIGNAPGLIIEKCIVRNNDYNGIYVNKSSTPIIRYNQLYDNGSYGIHFDETAGTISGTIQNNLVWDNASGIRVRTGSVANVYSNILYSNTNYGLIVDDANSNITAKNNIIAENGTYEIQIVADVDQAIDVDHTQYYHSGGGTPYHYKGTDCNFADWKTNSSQDANSPIPADPLFTNAAGDDFTLKPNSPCRHGAVYIPGYTTKLRPEASWPDNVVTMEDILSIGAYGVYRGSAGY